MSFITSLSGWVIVLLAFFMPDNKRKLSVDVSNPLSLLKQKNFSNSFISFTNIHNVFKNYSDFSFIKLILFMRSDKG